MSGFAHDLAGGNGNLVIAGLQSPNYNPGLGTGWQVRKDGSATFYSVSLPNTPGTTVTFASSAPGSPRVGDVWYDTAAGLLAFQWNGFAWVPYSISAGAIAAGDNQNPNPYFAGGDTSNWTAFNGAVLAAVTTSGISYPYAGQLTAPAGSTNPIVTGPQFACAEGDPIQVNSWFLTNTSDAVLAVSFFDALGGFIGTLTTPVTAGPDWQYVAFADLALPGSASASIAFGILNPSTAGTEVVQVTAATVMTKVNGTLIERGTLTPVFFYSGGQLLMSIAAAAGTDPATGTPYQAGAWVYGPSGSFIGMFDSGTQAELALLPPGPVTSITNKPALFAAAFNAGNASEETYVVLTSGRESGNDDAAIQLFADSADLSARARAVIEFGGTTVFAVGKTSGVILAGQPAPPANGGSATLYATTVGGLNVVDGKDSQVYATQRRTVVSAGQSVTTLATVFSSPVGARTYRVSGKVFFNLSAAATITAQVNGPASGNIGWTGVRSTAVVVGFDLTTFGSSAAISGSVALANGYVMDLDGVIVVSGNTTLQVQLAVSAGTMTVLANSYMDVMPV